jgi:hypothetical protein
VGWKIKKRELATLNFDMADVTVEKVRWLAEDLQCFLGGSIVFVPSTGKVLYDFVWQVE